MDWKQVSSSNIAEIAWEAGDMYVRFLNGRSYMYHEVYESDFNDCLNADSVGSYFAAHIKPNHAARQLL